MFLLDNSQSERIGFDLTAFVEELAKCYNQICINLKNTISKVSPHSMLVTGEPEWIDPTDISECSQLIELPDARDLKQIILRYSGYSTEAGVADVQFFHQEMQTTLLNYLKPMPLMKERKEEFIYVQFVGDSGHFLIEMKGEEHIKTLK